MKLVIFFLTAAVAFGVQTAAIGQLHDNVWMLGGGKTYDTLGYNFGVIRMGFENLNSPSLVRVPQTEILYQETNIALSDELGSLQFYSNGFRIENHAHQVMEAGNHISNRPNEPTYHLPQGMLGLPRPGSNHLYGVFQMTWEHLPFQLWLGAELFYNEVDMSENNGLGKVTVRKQSLLRDTLVFGSMTATRHANGRDWWVLAWENASDRVYRIRYGDDGAVFLDPQQTGVKRRTSSSGQAVFSPDGSRYIIVAGGNDISSNPADTTSVYFFDFDRCTGLLTFRHSQHLFDLPYGQGAAISHNSRYAYVSTLNKMYQFDLWDEDHGFEHIGEYDGNGTPFAHCAIYLLQLASNGRIYGACVDPIPFLNVIDHPDRQGAASGFRQRGAELPAISGQTIPNFPNYRLGPLDGSPCDTLDLDNIPVAKFRYDQDTLDYLKIEFTDLSYYEPSEWSWDFGDGTTSTDTSLVHTFPGSGVYEVCLTVSNQYGQGTYCQTLDLGTVGTGEAAPDVDVSIFPNPCRETVNVSIHDYLPKDAKVVFYDAIGQRQLEQSVWAGWNRVALDGLAAGVYFYQVWEQEVLIGKGKVVKVE